MINIIELKESKNWGQIKQLYSSFAFTDTEKKQLLKSILFDCIYNHKELYAVVSNSIDKIDLNKIDIEIKKEVV